MATGGRRELQHLSAGAEERMKVYLAQGRQPPHPKLDRGERGANHTLEWIARAVRLYLASSTADPGSTRGDGCGSPRHLGRVVDLRLAAEDEAAGWLGAVAEIVGRLPEAAELGGMVRIYLSSGGRAGLGSMQHVSKVLEDMRLYLVSGGTGAPDGPSQRLMNLVSQSRYRQALLQALVLLFGHEPSEDELEALMRVYLCVGYASQNAERSILASLITQHKESCLALYRLLSADLRAAHGDEPSEEALAEMVKIYLCSTHSNDSAPLETQRNASLGQLGRLGELMKLFLCTWPHGAGGDPRDISKSMKIFLSTGRAYRPGDLDAMQLATQKRVSPFKRPIRLLLSYHYYKANDLDALLKECFEGVPIDIFADSGAYSAASLGETVDPDDYIRWVEKWKHHFSAVSAPDVIGDAEATKTLTLQMLGVVKGVPVLPVFHVGEPWTYLDYWSHYPGCDYMALGGMVPHRKDRKLLYAWLKKCFSIIPREMRVHGFGMTSWPDLVRWPWYSVDSSSWTAGFRFARVQLFDEQRGEIDEVDMRSRTDLLRKMSLIGRYGLQAKELLSQTYDRDVLCGVCVESWQRAEAWLEAHQARQKKIFLAAGSNKGGPNHVAELGKVLTKPGEETT